MQQIDRTTKYALDVLAGRVAAGELVKLACQRHIEDIEKSKLAPYRYHFDVEKAERIIDFAETLTIAVQLLRFIHQRRRRSGQRRQSGDDRPRHN